MRPGCPAGRTRSCRRTPQLAINVSAIRSPGIAGAPVAFQTGQDTATCPSLQLGIVTEVVTAAAVTPSDDVCSRSRRARTRAHAPPGAGPAARPRARYDEAAAPAGCG